MITGCLRFSHVVANVPIVVELTKKPKFQSTTSGFNQNRLSNTHFDTEKLYIYLKYHPAFDKINILNKFSIFLYQTKMKELCFIINHK